MCRNLKLRILIAPGARPRIGPRMVEDIFALAVRFQIGGRGGDERAGRILDQQGCGLPAGARPHAARFLEQRKEGMADEGIAAVV